MKSDYENDIVRPAPRHKSARLQLTFPSFPPNSSSPPSPRPSTPSWLPSKRRSRLPRSGRRLPSRPTHQKRRRRRRRRSRTRVAATLEEARPPRTGRRLRRGRLPRNRRAGIAASVSIGKASGPLQPGSSGRAEGTRRLSASLRACLGLEAGMVEQKCRWASKQIIPQSRAARNACLHVVLPIVVAGLPVSVAKNKFASPTQRSTLARTRRRNSTNLG